MRSKYFGDSYDIVKRFFIGILTGLKYKIELELILPNGEDKFKEKFTKFLGANKASNESSKTALFIDPDTGIKLEGRFRKNKHISLDTIVNRCDSYKLVERSVNNISFMQPRFHPFYSAI